jgi:hypothetical protein
MFYETAEMSCRLKIRIRVVHDPEPEWRCQPDTLTAMAIRAHRAG